MADTVKGFDRPSLAQVWQALRILYGTNLAAATVTVLVRTETTYVFDTVTVPKEEKHG